MHFGESTMVICGICHEDDLLEVGELDCCDHR